MARGKTLLLSDILAQRMIDAGIIEGDKHIRRIVIDLQSGEAVKMYVEYLVDEKLLDIVPGSEGIEIIHTRGEEVDNTRR